MTSARTFDLKIVPKDGAETTFSSINKEEHEIVETFLKAKKLRVKNEINDDMLLSGAAVAQLDDDSDEEMGSAASSDGGKGKKAVNMMDDDSEEGMHSFCFFLQSTFLVSCSDGGDS